MHPESTLSLLLMAAVPQWGGCGDAGGERGASELETRYLTRLGICPVGVELRVLCTARASTS